MVTPETLLEVKRVMEAVIVKKRLLLAVVLGFASSSWAGSARKDAVDRMDNAAQVLHEILAAPDQGIPEEVLVRSDR